ncbi:DUF6416 domain-containing protein [Micromonospora sp. CNB394]|uniref:DUF6416 domain-containing protein n=1 Tax=Micromonospora sp. CNB394 TaxID=1169151 RepID=UPI0003619B8A|nr:DUF6416 domain-containing protein [Micromonospora sp. CNB394]
MLDITVKVPPERVADFYSMYGRWLAGADAASAGQVSGVKPEPTDWTQADVDLARTVWGRFSDNAKALFSTLIDQPGREFDGDDLAESLNIPNGRHGVAGVLAWPSRHCAAAGRNYCWLWSSREGGPVVYWMTDELAGLFRQAREG